ncbi:Asialoglycoprotein receptor 1, partial [Orchesella cincta]
VNMTRTSKKVDSSISLRKLGAVVGTIVRLLILASSQSQSNALLDATIPADGEPPIIELDNSNWVILRKQLTWGEASAICDKKYFRLTMLATREKAQELVDKIASISEPYTPEYDQKYMEVEFGMDRRYWIGELSHPHIILNFHRNLLALFISRRFSFGRLRLALGIIVIRHLQLISSWESTALQDAAPLADGEPDVKELGTTNWIIIRLTDIVQEGKWYWINDGSELSYEFWYPNQPDHQKINGALKSGEHCVTLWNPAYHAKDNHSFNDDECKNKYYAICDVAEV